LTTRLSPQLALSVGLDDAATLENLLAWDGIAAPRACAREAPRQEALTFLHGGAEGGKSHLLQGTCHRVSGAVYLPLEPLLPHAPADVFEGLEEAPLIALDDLHLAAGRASWEEALFHLINRCRPRGCALWVASRRPPAAMEIALPDLRSRLAGGVIWALPSPDDDTKIAILRFRAERRGLRLDEAVARYLLARQTRTLASMLTALERLDEASLRTQRALTIPFLRDVMGW